MNAINKVLALVLMLSAALAAQAQSNGSNSSYSRFGLGLLNDRSQGFNRGMGGVAQGFRSEMQVNALNPASYSATDSLTFIFDVGMSLQTGHLTGGGASVSPTNASLAYVNSAFRLSKGLGMSIGFIPYSTIGYSFNKTKPVAGSNALISKTGYYGNGGLHELYIGAGWNPFADLSIGANIGYMWGEYNHSMAQTLSGDQTASSSADNPTCIWSSDLKTYKLDIGAQYPVALNSKNTLTLGATAGIGHSIGSKVEFVRYTSLGDTTTYEVSKAFDLPLSVSAGATWQFRERLSIGADYTLQRWQGCRVPTLNKNQTDIIIATDQYRNMHRVAIGAEYTHDPDGLKYTDHIRYRVGGSYSTPYVKVNNLNGPTELRLTAGVAVPVRASARSLINVSVEWLKRTPSAGYQIKENYFLVHLGVTFNEAWFMKRKFQ